MVKIIDTNLILRLILGDISEQVESAEKLLESKRVTVLNISIFECVYVLEGTYEMARQQIATSLQPILMHPNIDCDNVCLPAFSIYLKNNNLSYADCYLLEYTKQNNGKLYTFDKKLIKQSASIATQP